MAENDSDGFKGSPRQNPVGRKRRESPMIDSQATDVTPAAEAVPEASVAAPSPEPHEPAQSPHTSEEPVLFGQVLRGTGTSVPSSGAVDSEAEAAGPTPSDTGAGRGHADPLAVPRTGEGPSGAAFGGLFGDPSVPLGPEPAAVPPPPTRRSLAAVLGAVAVLLLLVITGLMLFGPQRGSIDDLKAALESNGNRLAALEAKPEPAPVAAQITQLDQRLNGLDAGVATVKKTVDDLASQNKTMTAASQGATASDLAGVTTRLDELGRKVDTLPNATGASDFAQRLDAVQSSVAALPKVDLGPLDKQIGDLVRQIDAVDMRLTALATTIAALPKIDLAPLQSAAAVTQQRLAALETVLAAPKAGDRATEARAVGSAEVSRAAPLAIVAQEASRGLDEGRPIGSEVDALRALGVEEARLAPLDAVAAKGAATPATLKTDWASVEPEVLAILRPAEGSLLDRFAAGARQIVTVRRVGAPAGEDPGSVASGISAALDAGDIPGALATWDRLPEAARTASQAWHDGAQARVDAQAAVKGLASSAIETLAKAKG